MKSARQNKDEKFQTLEELEGDIWPAAPEDSSPIVARCHALRRTPLANLSAGDCRTLITQGIGERFLVPLALSYLEKNPLLEGDYYQGDLLVAMMRIEKKFWHSYPREMKQLSKIVLRATAMMSDDVSFNSDRQLRKDIESFLAVKTFSA